MATFWHYAKVELVPPMPAEIPTVATQSLKKIYHSDRTGSFKQLTVKEALLNDLVDTEKWMWFYVDRSQTSVASLAIMSEDQSFNMFHFGLLFECSWTMCGHIE